MPRPGDVVVAEFPGATGPKSRPVVVLSSTEYHASRPDVVVGVLTSQIHKATAPSDYRLSDWRAAGLAMPSAFRAYLATVRSADVTPIGRLSEADWAEVKARCRVALDICQEKSAEPGST